MSEYPYVAFALKIGAWTIAEDALVDTGYDGGLIISEEAQDGIVRLPKRVELQMPDGRSHRVSVWTGILQLETRTFQVDVRAFGDEFILGREILDQMEVCFEFGRKVRFRFE